MKNVEKSVLWFLMWFFVRPGTKWLTDRCRSAAQGLGTSALNQIKYGSIPLIKVLLTAHGQKTKLFVRERVLFDQRTKHIQIPPAFPPCELTSSFTSTAFQLR